MSTEPAFESDVDLREAIQLRFSAALDVETLDAITVRADGNALDRRLLPSPDDDAVILLEYFGVPREAIGGVLDLVISTELRGADDQVFPGASGSWPIPAWLSCFDEEVQRAAENIAVADSDRELLLVYNDVEGITVARQLSSTWSKTSFGESVRSLGAGGVGGELVSMWGGPGLSVYRTDEVVWPISDYAVDRLAGPASPPISPVVALVRDDVVTFETISWEWPLFEQPQFAPLDAGAPIRAEAIAALGNQPVVAVATDSAVTTWVWSGSSWDPFGPPVSISGDVVRVSVAGSQSRVVLAWTEQVGPAAVEVFVRTKDVLDAGWSSAEEDLIGLVSPATAARVVLGSRDPLGPVILWMTDGVVGAARWNSTTNVWQVLPEPRIGTDIDAVGLALDRNGAVLIGAGTGSSRVLLHRENQPSP